MNNCIGLFGTCGDSQWRKSFIAMYNLEGIPFFDPQKEDWSPEDAVIEAEHLVNDSVVLFPVTGETYGTGSLAETGFSIMQAIRSTTHTRFVVIYVEKDLDPSLKKDALAYRESLRARALVLAHLKKIQNPNVFIVESLKDMFEISVRLHEVVTILNSLRNPNA